MLRLLLTCLLAIALPLKALAAVTMVGCGPVHHGARGSVEVPVAAPAGADHHGGDAAGGMHHAVGEPAPVDAGDTKPSGAADAGKQHAKAASTKCSSCAPCCAAAAPAPELQRFAGMEPASDELPSATSAYRGVVDDVPHKPPRLFLA